MENVKKIAELLNIKNSQVEKVLELTAEGNTVPFIARYRKEATGSLDEVEIKKIIDEDNLQTKLSERKTAVLSKIEELGKLTDSLKAQILAAEKLTEVEDLYLPYKEKRRTKATIAKENGLFPLAQLIVKNSANLEEEAEKFVKSTNVDFLAIGIGNSHGFYKAEPKLQYDILEAVKARTGDVPLVLHGTSGIPDEDVSKAVAMGIAKVNYATELRAVFTNAIKSYISEDEKVVDPKKYNSAAKQAVKELVKQKIQVLGSDGKAEE